MQPPQAGAAEPGVLRHDAVQGGQAPPTGPAEGHSNYIKT